MNSSFLYKIAENIDFEQIPVLWKDINFKQFSEHKWLITYDDSEYIRSLFSFAYINEWNLIYGMRNVGKNGNQNGKELFISNYPILEKKMIIQPTLFKEYEGMIENTPGTLHIGNSG